MNPLKRLPALIKKLKAIDSEILKIIRSVIEENEGFIVEMNSEDQLFEKGIYADGESIDETLPYSPVTISIKQDKGQPTDRVTLRDEEDFHRAFIIEFRPTEFEIRSTDDKEEKLVYHYGPKIFGLTEENYLDVAHSYIAPTIREFFKTL